MIRLKGDEGGGNMGDGGSAGMEGWTDLNDGGDGC